MDLTTIKGPKVDPVTVRKGQQPPKADPAIRGSTNTNTNSSNDREPTKRRRADNDPEMDSEEGDPQDLSVFNLGDLMKTKDGTFKVPKYMKSYLNKHMKHCLTKEALFKDHSRPDLDSCVPPKIDKYMSEFLGKRMPKERDLELARDTISCSSQYLPANFGLATPIGCWPIRGTTDDGPSS